MGVLSENALKVAESRYFMDGENWEKCTLRVANFVSQNEIEKQKYIDAFHEMMYEMFFIPGGRVLRNAARQRGSMFQCHNVPIGDSIREIGQCKMDSLILWSDGGGVGINFSPLRPKDAVIKGIGGESSGLVSFMKTIDYDASVIKTGGGRRAAALGLIDVTHPELMNFIDAKLKDGDLSHFNISVAITKEFIEAVMEDKNWEFKFNQISYGTIKARVIWDKILVNMLERAEPGLLNWDNIQKNNSYFFAPILSTNPSLRAGTKILTRRGIFPIEQLSNTAFQVPTIAGGFSNSTCSLSGNNKNLYEIKLQGGHSYFATAEHKWPIIKKDKWEYTSADFTKKSTLELKPGDYLPQPTKKTSLNFGTEGTYDDGFLIGWNIGDGWISNNDRPSQFGFMVSEADDKSNISDILKNSLKALGWKGDFHLRLLDKCKYTHVQNKNVRNFFERFGVSKKEEGIPKALWNTASEDFRKGFIDGIFSSDGCVDLQAHGRIILVSAHYKLIHDISELLGFYGINSSIVERAFAKGKFPNGKDYDKLYKSYNLRITRQSSILQFYNTFRLSHQSKQEKLKSIIEAFTLIPSASGVKIIEIIKTDLYEDVWDITVKDDFHCFELPQVITGNCGEAILSAYGSCVLGSIVLPKFVSGQSSTNWVKLESVIRLGIRFLDNLIDVNHYSLETVKTSALNSRRIGLGIMGLAELFFMKKIRYGSERSILEIERLMAFIRNIAYDESINLAKEKGSFPAFQTVPYCKASFIRKLPAKLRMKIRENGIRNVTILALAPTGSISMLPEVSSGIEPLYAKAYLRKDRIGERIYMHPLYRQLLESNEEIPDWYVDTYDLKPDEHIEIQTACQKYVDGGVSKTINLPSTATKEDLDKLLLESIFDLKGVTVYRDGSRGNQPLNRLSLKEVKTYLKKEEKIDSNLTEEDVKCVSGSCEL